MTATDPTTDGLDKPDGTDQLLRVHLAVVDPPAAIVEATAERVATRIADLQPVRRVTRWHLGATAAAIVAAVTVALAAGGWAPAPVQPAARPQAASLQDNTTPVPQLPTLPAGIGEHMSRLARHTSRGDSLGGVIGSSIVVDATVTEVRVPGRRGNNAPEPIVNNATAIRVEAVLRGDPQAVERALREAAPLVLDRPVEGNNQLFGGGRRAIDLVPGQRLLIGLSDRNTGPQTIWPAGRRQARGCLWRGDFDADWADDRRRIFALCERLEPETALALLEAALRGDNLDHVDDGVFVPRGQLSHAILAELVLESLASLGSDEAGEFLEAAFVLHEACLAELSASAAPPVAGCRDSDPVVRGSNWLRHDTLVRAIASCGRLTTIGPVLRDALQQEQVMSSAARTLALAVVAATASDDAAADLDRAFSRWLRRPSVVSLDPYDGYHELTVCWRQVYDAREALDATGDHSWLAGIADALLDGHADLAGWRKAVFMLARKRHMDGFLRVLDGVSDQQLPAVLEGVDFWPRDASALTVARATLARLARVRVLTDTRPLYSVARFLDRHADDDLVAQGAEVAASTPVTAIRRALKDHWLDG